MRPIIPSRFLSIHGCAVFIFLVISACPKQAHTQDPPTPVAETYFDDAADTDDSQDTIKLVSQQIGRLNDSSYRVRQTARSVIEKHPSAALEVIAKEIRNAEAVVGIQLVDVLSGLAMHSDLAISSKATELLSSLANDATSIGRGANNSLSAIADLQEEKAVEVLTHHGAYIGPQNFSLNGRLDLNPSRLGLSINDDFNGTDAELEWIRFLKSVQVVYLRGKKISPIAIEAASTLKQLKAIRLQGFELKPEQLLRFKDVASLEHLGLSYVPVDDSFIPIIAQLPITESIRLYGTKITEAGKQQLMDHFKELEIFRGSGGFLGISSTTNSTTVDKVTRGSAAQLAGIREGDRILAINDVPVKTFEQLRTELGKYQAGEEINVAIERFSYRLADDELQAEPLVLKATLQEES